MSSSVRYPVAYFYTKSATTEQLTAILNDGLTTAYQGGLDILYTLCDGGSANRAMIKVCLSDEDRWASVLAYAFPLF